MSQNRDYPGNLPLLPMGWGAANLDFEGADNFWEEAQRITEGSSLGDNLDIALAGESSPRIWLFLHEPGHASLSCAAALEIARELGTRDQAVLILDCDDADSQLTRWAGRHESEGWIDLVRYGASVLTSGVAMPFEGRRGYILGVGSFTPTDVTAQEADDLINRLKRQADDLILVAPANEAGKLWARLADIRLLCWDRARKSHGLIERVCDGFEESGSKLTGLIGFGLPEEGMILGAGNGSDTKDPAALDEPLIESEDDFSEEDSDERLEAEDLQDIDYTDVDAAADEEAEEPDPVLVSEYVTPAEDEDVDVAVAGDSGSGSSRVFWGAAVVTLLLIAAVSFYYLKYVRPGDEEAPGVSPPVAVQEQPQEQVAVVTEEILAEDDSLDPESPDVADDDPAGPAEDQPTGAGIVADQPVQTLPEETTPPAAQTEVVDKPAPVFSMDPYLLAVGSDGWALHLYSFPDSASAEAEASRLERRGFQTAIRPFEIKDKGRWFRVYVGSFVSKSEAREAQGPLMEKLKVDWARATEF